MPSLPIFLVKRAARSPVALNPAGIGSRFPGALNRHRIDLAGFWAAPRHTIRLSPVGQRRRAREGAAPVWGEHSDATPGSGLVRPPSRGRSYALTVKELSVGIDRVPPRPEHSEKRITWLTRSQKTGRVRGRQSISAVSAAR